MAGVTSPDSFRLTAFLLVLAFMYAAESFWPERPWTDRRLKRLAAHGGLTVLNTLILRLTVAAPLAVWVLYVQDRNWGLAGWLGLTGGLDLAATFIVYDGTDYWWHRFNHTVPFLWRFHRAHHLDTHVDVTTSLRFHPGELLLSAGMKALWIPLWGPSLWGYALCEAGITAFAQYHHSNVRYYPDRLERVVRLFHITPRLHASHHTVALRSRDANYSTIFSWWDRLFGTFAEPADKELKALGLPESGPDYLSPRAVLAAPLTAR